MPTLVQVLKLSFSSKSGSTADKDNSSKNWGDHVKIGQMDVRNRICLASMTRQRCDPKDGVPNDLLAKYYEQRSGAGLVFIEAASWAQSGEAFPGAGNLYTKEQA